MTLKRAFLHQKQSCQHQVQRQTLSPEKACSANYNLRHKVTLKERALLPQKTQKPVGAPKKGHTWVQDTTEPRGGKWVSDAALKEAAQEELSAEQRREEEEQRQLKRHTTMKHAEYHESWTAGPGGLPSVFVEKLNPDQQCARKTECRGCCVCARLFCSLCLERGATNTFTGNGCDNFRKAVVSQHRQSEAHSRDWLKQQTSVGAALSAQLELHWKRIAARTAAACNSELPQPQQSAKASSQQDSEGVEL